MRRAEAVRLAQLKLGEQVRVERRRVWPRMQGRHLSRWQVAVIMPCICGGHQPGCSGLVHMATGATYGRAIANLSAELSRR